MIESMGPFGGGADQESGSMGVGLAGAWGFSGEPGTGSIWKVGFVGTHLESGFAGAHWKPGATGTAWAMSAGQCWGPGFDGEPWEPFWITGIGLVLGWAMLKS